MSSMAASMTTTVVGSPYVYLIAQHLDFTGVRLGKNTLHDSDLDFTFRDEPMPARRLSFSVDALSDRGVILPLEDLFNRLDMEKAMSITNSVVAIYGTHVQAEHAIKELQEAGVDMKSLSIAAKVTHTNEHVVGYYDAGDRMKYWDKMGAFWGGFWGLLFGSGFFLIPGLGPILVAGPLVAWTIAGLEGAAVVGGVSAVGAGLVSIGIPKDSVLKYEVALKTDKFLLVVHGTEDPVAKAKNDHCRN